MIPGFFNLLSYGKFFVTFTNFVAQLGTAFKQADYTLDADNTNLLKQIWISSGDIRICCLITGVS